MRRDLVVGALVLAVVLAGCSLPFVGHPEEPRGGDAIGWENGYWYDDPVDVTTSDGLNESELSAVTARTMARIEHIRDREFESTVPVEVISRAEYRNRSRSNESAGPGGDPWNDQVWEALLLIGEDSGSSEEIDNTLQMLAVPVSNAAKAQALRRRYWILKYLEKMKGKVFESLALEVHRDFYVVLLKDIMLEWKVPAGGMSFKPGDLARVTVQHANARKDQLSLFI